MAPKKRAVPAAASGNATVPTAALVAPKQEMKPIGWFKPYEFNPRDNKAAIDSVAESIKQFGFLVPLVADEDGVLAAGHTRHAAAMKLKMKELPVIIANHLTKAQLDAFRLVDNKVSELAGWDVDLLAGEISKLQEVGINLTPFGWTQEELDCLSDMVGDDCLDQVQQLAGAGDGVNSAATEGRSGGSVISKDSKSVKIAIGQFGFFIPVEMYQAWADAQRKKHNYNDDAVINALANTLGLLDGHTRHQELVGERRAAASAAVQDVKEKQAAAPQRQKAVGQQADTGRRAAPVRKRK